MLHPSLPVGGDIFECSVPAGGTKTCQISNASLKEAFIREFGQQQCDCTTCGLISVDEPFLSSCRTLGSRNAFNTGKCVVDVKGSQDAKTPNDAPTKNQPALDAVQGFCCSCVGGTPFVKPCSQGGQCFATGDPHSATSRRWKKRLVLTQQQRELWMQKSSKKPYLTL